MKLRFENHFWQKGIRFIAGVDEAGRGPLAGPVVAAAVVLPPHIKVPGIADSKKLSAKAREQIFCELEKKSLAIGVGIVSHLVIDRINIFSASLLAMRKAVLSLGIWPNHILIDGKRNCLALPFSQESIVGGDGKIFSIAAASVVAKVVRDRLMLHYHRLYPEYGFCEHKGYGTRRHLEILRLRGPSPVHRRSFSPVKASG